MSNDPAGRRPRSADLHSSLRLVALGAVAAGVALLAVAAFVLSYEGIHQIALQAGVSQKLAKLYPLIFDVMLVIAAAAALSLRGASWWARFYAWASLLIVLAAMAVGNAVHAIGTTLPAKPAKVAVAVIPWVLLLAAFGLLLEMLQHFRTTRSAAAKAAAAAASGAAADDGPRMVAAQAAVDGTVRQPSRVDLDTLLGPRAGEPPAIGVLYSIGASQADGHQVDPVSYGEETGYVHPDSYLDEGEYSPHGDTGGPGSPAAQAGDNAGDGTHVAKDGASAAAPATAAPATATAEETPATSADATATPTETPTAPAETTATTAEATAIPAESTATPAETPAASAETTATATATPAAAEAAPTPAASAAATPTLTQSTASSTPANAVPAEAAATPAASAAAATATLTETAASSTPAPATPAAAMASAPAAPAESPATATAVPAEATATATPEAAPPPEATAASAETQAAATPTPAEAGASPAPATVGGMASVSENGQAAGEDRAAVETPTGPAEDGHGGDDGVTPDAASAAGPALERIRSTPTRPE